MHTVRFGTATFQFNGDLSGVVIIRSHAEDEPTEIGRWGSALEGVMREGIRRRAEASGPRTGEPAASD